MLSNRTYLFRWLGGTLCSSVFFLTPLFLENQSPLLAQTQTESSTDFKVMTLSLLDTILREETNNLRRINRRQWRFQIQGRSLILVADEDSNRMRLMTPIKSAEALSSDEFFNMMIANYHTALDARYAINQQGIVVALFLHPLASLQEKDLLSALRQVTQLAETFGTNYSSGELYFENEDSPSPESSPNSPSQIGI